MGLRYRVDFRVGTGKGAPRPDIAFTRAKVAVFVDGCFWHGCPTHGAVPKVNSDYWAPKLARTRERDALNDQHLTDQGWVVMRFWEHDDPLASAEAVAAAVRRRPDPGTHRPGRLQGPSPAAAS